MLLSTYDALAELLPEAFTLTGAARRRDSVIMHALLRQIPGVGHVPLEKLYASGVNSLEALFVATARDLAVVSGVSKSLCEKICRKVQEHRDRLQGGSAAQTQVDPRAILTELVQELQRQHESFCRVSNADEVTPESKAAKRETLRSRRDCALRIDVVLAEMGEIELIDELKKLAVERRIERLEQHLNIESIDTTGNQPSARGS